MRCITEDQDQDGRLRRSDDAGRRIKKLMSACPSIRVRSSGHGHPQRGPLSTARVLDAFAFGHCGEFCSNPGSRSCTWPAFSRMMLHRPGPDPAVRADGRQRRLVLPADRDRPANMSVLSEANEAVCELTWTLWVRRAAGSLGLGCYGWDWRRCRCSTTLRATPRQRTCRPRTTRSTARVPNGTPTAGA